MGREFSGISLLSKQTSPLSYTLKYFHLINHEKFKDKLNFSEDFVRRQHSVGDKENRHEYSAPTNFT